ASYRAAARATVFPCETWETESALGRSKSLGAQPTGPHNSGPLPVRLRSLPTRLDVPDSLPRHAEPASRVAFCRPSATLPCWGGYVRAGFFAASLPPLLQPPQRRFPSFFGFPFAPSKLG